MRILEEIDKSGYFWLPTNPDHKIPGNIKIIDGGSITLEVIGLLDESIDGLNKTINNKANIGRIVGQIEKYGMVTLDFCYYLNASISFGGVSKSFIYVGRAILGISYGENEEIEISSFRFTVDNLDEWIGISGIKVEWDIENKSATIKYTPLDDIHIILKNDMNLIVTYEWTLPSFAKIKEAKITQCVYFKIESKNARPIQEYIELARKITNLMCFAMNKTVSLQNASIRSQTKIIESLDRETKILSSQVYYKSIPYSESKPKIDVDSMLFNFQTIERCFGSVVNNWLFAYERYSSSLNLYFSAKTGGHRYIEGNFLSLAQCLETYHRKISDKKLMNERLFIELCAFLVRLCPKSYKTWLEGRISNGNEINLTQRIKDIVDPYKNLIGNSKYRGKLISSIVKTRNYLTHYDERLKKEACEGIALMSLSSKLELLFQLHLLDALGFNRSDIENILNQNANLQFKLNMPL